MAIDWFDQEPQNYLKFIDAALKTTESCRPLQVSFITGILIDLIGTSKSTRFWTGFYFSAQLHYNNFQNTRLADLSKWMSDNEAVARSRILSDSANYILYRYRTRYYSSFELGFQQQKYGSRSRRCISIIFSNSWAASAWCGSAKTANKY
jgi:hypothetical protein